MSFLVLLLFFLGFFYCRVKREWKRGKDKVFSFLMLLHHHSHSSMFSFSFLSWWCIVSSCPVSSKIFLSDQWSVCDPSLSNSTFLSLSLTLFLFWLGLHSDRFHFTLLTSLSGFALVSIWAFFFAPLFFLSFSPICLSFLFLFLSFSLSLSLSLLSYRLTCLSSII